MRAIPFLSAATFLSGAGCDALTGAEDLASVSELRLRVATSRADVRPGDTLSIRVRAYNPTERPVRWPYAPCLPLMYRVYTSDGKRIAPSTDPHCGLISTSELIAPELAPGDSLVVVHRWSAIRDYGQQGPAQLLDPGAYSIVGGVAGGPDLLSESLPDTVWVRAP